ncbi:MAG: PilN domain-containing protein [Candidatus Omnitrophota bacterium]
MNREILILKYDGDHLAALSGARRGGKEWVRAFVRETVAESSCAKLKGLLGSSPSRKSFLVLPRTNIIQKHLRLELATGGIAKAEFKNRIQSLLPLPFEQMAHGAEFETSSKDVNGVIEALPEEGVEKRLKSLDSLGIMTEDVFCEDQSLFWYCRDRSGRMPTLAIEADSVRFLFVVFNKDRLLWSRAFSVEESDLGTGHILKDVWLDLLSQNIQVQEVLVCGPTGDSLLTDVKTQTDVSCRVLPPCEGGVPHSLMGCFYREGKKGISLLPEARKQLKRKRETGVDLKRAMFSALLLMVVLLGGFLGHFLYLQKQVHTLDAGIERIHSDVKRVQQYKHLLGRLNNQQLRKQKLIECLSDLHTQISGEIEFNSFEVGPQFRFSGESPSHAALSKTIQILEERGYFKNVTLKQTRLRKKLGKDYFEFEVEASWSS